MKSIALHVYTEKIEISDGVKSGERYKAEDFFRDASRFNYFEDQSLRGSGSLFVEGVDQRFLELTYNGFSLRDPSQPSGVFNINALSNLGDTRLTLKGSSGLNVETGVRESSQLSISGSQLGEAEMDSAYGTCSETSCRSLGLSLKRGGGFSQAADGAENDYFEEVTLNFSNSLFKGHKDFKTHFLYYGQRLDEDNINALADLSSESSVAESINSVLFLGQEVGLGEKIKLKASYLSSYRNQKDEEAGLSFRQFGEVVDFSLEHSNLFKIKGFKEDFNLYSSKGTDLGGVLSHKSSLKSGGSLSLELGKSEKRDYNWDLELGFKNFILFYKGVAPSLFQQDYNNEFAASRLSLDTQKVLGGRVLKNFKFNKVKFKVVQSYSRFYNFIDFDLSSNSYKNLGELENIFSSLELQYSGALFFIQHQISKEVEGQKRDLPRRPRWTLGLSGRQKISKPLSVFVSLKWLSERQAFDQTELKKTWLSEVRFDYKSFKLSATNVLNQKELFYKNLSRKSLAISLSYAKKF